MIKTILDYIKVKTFRAPYVDDRFLDTVGLSAELYIKTKYFKFDDLPVFNYHHKVEWANPYLTLSDKARIVDLYYKAHDLHRLSLLGEFSESLSKQQEEARFIRWKLDRFREQGSNLS